MKQPSRFSILWPNILEKNAVALDKVALENDDVKDDDDDDDDHANCKDVEVVEIDADENTNNAWKVSKPEIPIKGRK